MNELHARYLGLCHAYGWVASDEGLAAFEDQVARGLRGQDGNMIWKET